MDPRRQFGVWLSWALNDATPPAFACASAHVKCPRLFSLSRSLDSSGSSPPDSMEARRLRQTFSQASHQLRGEYVEAFLCVCHVTVSPPPAPTPGPLPIESHCRQRTPCPSPASGCKAKRLRYINYESGTTQETPSRRSKFLQQSLPCVN